MVGQGLFFRFDFISLSYGLFLAKNFGQMPINFWPIKLRSHDCHEQNFFPFSYCLLSSLR